MKLFDLTQLGISGYQSGGAPQVGAVDFRQVQEGSDETVADIARDEALSKDVPEAAQAPSDLSEVDLSNNGVAFQIGANGLNINGVSVATRSQANEAIDYVSKTCVGLGAMQNRLEHTINNLGVNSENAELRIRDVDMAKEMMAFTKNNILTQAAQAMLAQANQQPQGVLQLLG